MKIKLIIGKCSHNQNESLYFKISITHEKKVEITNYLSKNNINSITTLRKYRGKKSDLKIRTGALRTIGEAVKYKENTIFIRNQKLHAL